MSLHKPAEKRGNTPYLIFHSLWESHYVAIIFSPLILKLLKKPHLQLEVGTIVFPTQWLVLTRTCSERTRHCIGDHGLLWTSINISREILPKIHHPAGYDLFIHWRIKGTEAWCFFLFQSCLGKNKKDYNKFSVGSKINQDRAILHDFFACWRILLIRREHIRQHQKNLLCSSKTSL